MIIKTDKKYKTLAILCLAMLIFCLTGCGTGEKTPDKETAIEDSIKIEDIDWTVDERIIEEYRSMSFNYTNNTEYTIIDVELTFTQKEGTTLEQVKDVYKDFITIFEMTEEEMLEIDVLAFNHQFSKPGETLENSPCRINGHYLLETPAQYEIMEPSEMYIKYIGSDDKIHTVCYDYMNNTYVKSEETDELYIWSENKLSNTLPKPDAKVVSSDGDDEYYSFNIYDATHDQFNEYVEACKNNGFTIDETSNENRYVAKNTDGYEVVLDYSTDSKSIDGYIH